MRLLERYADILEIATFGDLDRSSTENSGRKVPALH